jgi:hypothetical protein
MSESPVNPVAAAMANALADATGIRFAKLPFTPPRLFEQLRALQREAETGVQELQEFRSCRIRRTLA